MDLRGTPQTWSSAVKEEKRRKKVKRSLDSAGISADDQQQLSAKLIQMPLVFSLFNLKLNAVKPCYTLRSSTQDVSLPTQLPFFPFNLTKEWRSLFSISSGTCKQMHTRGLSAGLDATEII